jgi:hypothetical protein
MKIKIFWVFVYFYGFSTQFPNTISKASSLNSEKVLSQEDSISKASSLNSEKVLSQEDSKFADLVLQGVKNALFFTSNATLTPKTESMFCLISFHAPYFENEWAKSK